MWCPAYFPPPHSLWSALHEIFTCICNVCIAIFVVVCDHRLVSLGGGIGTDNGCAGSASGVWKDQLNAKNTHRTPDYTTLVRIKISPPSPALGLLVVLRFTHDYGSGGGSNVVSVASSGAVSRASLASRNP